MLQCDRTIYSIRARSKKQCLDYAAPFGHPTHSWPHSPGKVPPPLSLGDGHLASGTVEAQAVAPAVVDEKQIPLCHSEGLP